LSSDKAGRNQKQNLTQQNPSRAQQKPNPAQRNPNTCSFRQMRLFNRLQPIPAAICSLRRLPQRSAQFGVASATVDAFLKNKPELPLGQENVGFPEALRRSPR
jgi:hypothetical protein